LIILFLQSVNELINDFDKANALVPKYKAAHVFFTEGNNQLHDLREVYLHLYPRAPALVNILLNASDFVF
jgi:hypothetical protein